MAQMNNQKVILCVDDEATGLSIRKMILQSQGYLVVTADNGVDALALFSSTIDLVVLDYLLPDMLGSLVAQEMKKLEPTTPILLLSAYVDLPSETIELVDRSITKGEPVEVFLDAVVDLLRNSKKMSSRSVA